MLTIRTAVCSSVGATWESLWLSIWGMDWSKGLETGFGYYLFFFFFTGGPIVELGIVHKYSLLMSFVLFPLSFFFPCFFLFPFAGGGNICFRRWWIEYYQQ